MRSRKPGFLGLVATAMAMVTISFAKRLDKTMQKQELNPSLNVLQPRHPDFQQGENLILTPDAETQRFSDANARYEAYKFGQENFDLDGEDPIMSKTYAHDSLSFFLDDGNTRELSNGGYAPRIKVGTDCSCMEILISALKNIGVKFDHIFSCDNDQYVKSTIQANCTPMMFYNPMTEKRGM